MNEKDLKVKAERYVELLSSYDNYVKAMEKVLQKIAETRKELLFLEKELEEAGVKIKDVE
tara:strand:- start:350 stop:529 length:180 start_codon:yes stop_codon:yes gene_type:complete